MIAHKDGKKILRFRRSWWRLDDSYPVSSTQNQTSSNLPFVVMGAVSCNLFQIVSVMWIPRASMSDSEIFAKVYYCSGDCRSMRHELRQKYFGRGSRKVPFCIARHLAARRWHFQPFIDTRQYMIVGPAFEASVVQIPCRLALCSVHDA